MIPKECRRLAEADFPIAEVSKLSAGEKYITHGYPSTLHLWWARRPLGACRSMLLGLLWPDPCDEACPEEFKTKARELLPPLLGNVGPSNEDLRRALLRFVGDFADWDLSVNPRYLEVSRELVEAGNGKERPVVVDSFAGGGAIPLEALRLGCETLASDLNPVACLILRTLLEDIPRNGSVLAVELGRVGLDIQLQAEKELAKFFPEDTDGGKPIAYLWARTVQCESPNCGAEIPLMTSFWLSKKANRRRALRYTIVRDTGSRPRLEFEVFEPQSETDVPGRTVTSAKATCPCCDAVLPPDRVRGQLVSQRGGTITEFDTEGNRIGGARLMAVVTIKTGETGRAYRVPTRTDYQAVWEAQMGIETIKKETLPSSLTAIPEESLPPIGTLGFRVQRYGMQTWEDLFTARQKYALVRFLYLCQEADASQQTRTLLAFAFDRVAMSCMSCTRWNASAEKMQHTFGRQALPIVWDFAEVVPTAKAPGNWTSGYELIKEVIERWPPDSSTAQVVMSDACDLPYLPETAGVWFTDPPYYDAVPYADLSDFFYVWLKRLLPGHPFARDPYDSNNPLTPKTREAVQNKRSFSEDGKPKDRAFYETAMGMAFSEGRRILKEDGVGCVVFAHKTTEGWESLLTGLIVGGWTITGSWPIATEMGSRLRARESAALSTSVHLICRPRPEDAPVGDWAEVLRELPKRVGSWMDRLQDEGVRGADLVFACIGPALEVYSRYSHVETADGTEVLLADYLQKVWEVVGRIALEQILGTAEASGTATALEEDARLTALFLWTLQATDGEQQAPTPAEAEEEDKEEEATAKAKPKGYSLIYDVVRRFAQPLGIGLPDWEGRIIKTEKGVVYLIPVSQRAKQLFGEEGAHFVAESLEKDTSGDFQLKLFPEKEEATVPRVKPGGRRRTGDLTDDSLATEREATTLDRVHAAMLLQASGRSAALRNMLKAEQDRSSDFLRLANALSALYPKGSEEKRLLDAMLLAVPK